MTWDEIIKFDLHFKSKSKATNQTLKTLKDHYTFLGLLLLITHFYIFLIPNQTVILTSFHTGLIIRNVDIQVDNFKVTHEVKF